MTSTSKKRLCGGVSVVSGAAFVFWLIQMIRIVVNMETRNRFYEAAQWIDGIKWSNTAFIALCLTVSIFYLKLSFENLIPLSNKKEAKVDSFIIGGLIFGSFAVVALCIFLTQEPYELEMLYGDVWEQYYAVDDVLLSSGILIAANGWMCYLSACSAKYYAKKQDFEEGRIKVFDEETERTKSGQRLLVENSVWIDRENKYTLEIIPEYDCGVLKYGESLLGVHFFKEGGTLSICNFYEDNVDYYPQNKNEWLAHGEFAYDGKELKIDINYIEEANTVLKKGIIRFYKNGEKI